MCFEDLIESIRSKVNHKLENMPLPVYPEYLYDPIRYSIVNKGKRFRAILTHLTGRANKIDSKAVMHISLAVELLHNFTLVHDDIMDDDTVRHGKMTIHEKWDSSTAILTGDGIYTIAQIILAKISKNFKSLSKYFNKTTLEICEGQGLDKQFENDKSITIESYLDMIDKKTGSLIGASSALPIIYQGGSEDLINTYEKFGRSLGKGFQIHDDLLEITTNSHVMGKSLGSDIHNGKQTIMVILARDSFPRQWDELVKNSDRDNIVKNSFTFFDKKGIIREVKSISDSYFESSLDYLKGLENTTTQELNQLVHLIKNRTY